MSYTDIPYKPRIFRIGLVLIGFSIATSVALVLFLARTWFVTNDIALKDRTQNLYVAQLNTTVADWNLSNGSLSATLTRYQPEFFSRISKSAASRLAPDLSRLASLSEGDPKRLAAVHGLERLLREETNTIVAGNFAALDFGAMSREGAEKFSGTLTRTIEIRTELQEILNGQWDLLQEERRNEDAVRQQLKNILLLSASISTLVAIVTMVSFARLVRAKVHTVINSARRIGTAQGELAKLAGDDEFAYINRVLEETSGKLQEAAGYRKSFIEMVAHDMRSPVMSAQIYFDLVISASENCPGNLHADLESCSTKLDHIIQYANDLLSKLKIDTPAAGVTPGDAMNGTPSAKGREQSQEREQGQGLDARMQPRPLQFSISKKILLVICIPALLQIGLFAYIGNELHKSEAIIVNERKIGDVIMRSNLAEFEFVRSAMLQGAYVIRDSVQSHDLAMKGFDRATYQLDVLKTLCQGDPDWSEFVRLRTQVSILRMNRLRALSPGDSFGAILRAFASVTEVKESLPDARSARHLQSELYKRDYLRLTDMADEQNRIAEKIKQILIAAPAAELALAILLLVALNADLVKRLNILVCNAIKLGKGEPLTDAVGGGDELSQLDDVLYDAKQALSQAATQRRTLTAGLMYEFGRPLKEIIHRLDDLEKTTAEALGGQESTRLGKSKNILKQVLMLLDDLMIVESLQTGHIDLNKVDCDIHAVASEATEIVVTQATQKKISIINECCSQFIAADRTRLVQLLVNYLSNAIKFSPEGAEIGVSSAEHGQSVTISVTDRGTGMDEETRTKVFEKHFQADSAQKSKGFGLGLAICNFIADAHGWRLGVDSEVGRGSTFWIEIPKTQAERSPIG